MGVYAPLDPLSTPRYQLCAKAYKPLTPPNAPGEQASAAKTGNDQFGSPLTHRAGMIELHRSDATGG